MEKENEKKIHKFGSCSECSSPKTDYHWCEKCDNAKLIQNFPNWTSGNRDFDEFIQDTQRNAKSYTSYYEYIPFDDFEFENIGDLAKDWPSKLCIAWWKK